MAQEGQVSRLNRQTKRDIFLDQVNNGLSGELDSVIEYLQGLKTHYPNYTRLYLQESWDASNPIFLYGERLETDEEYDERIAREKKIKERKKKEAQKRKDIEYKEYVRLKKKFENNDPV